MKTFNATAAHKSFTAREKAARELRDLAERGIRTNADRERERYLVDEVAKHDTAVKEAIAAGLPAAKAARSVEKQRALGVTYRTSVEHADRSISDVRLWGNSIGEMRDSDFASSVDARPVPVILNASGRGSRLIERFTVYPFTRQFGYVPVTPKVTAEIQPRNVAQAAEAARVSTVGTAALKVSAVVSIDNDTLTDVPATEDAINTALAAAVGQRVDDVLINGGDDGDTVAPGILDKGVRTAALSSIGYDQLADAVARIETSGGIADAVIGDPIAIASLRKAILGDKLSTLPEFVSLPPLADGTPILPVDTVIVADLNSCGVGIRENLEVAMSTNEPEAYETDSAFLVGRARICSIVLADAARVQVLTTQAV